VWLDIKVIRFPLGLALSISCFSRFACHIPAFCLNSNGAAHSSMFQCSRPSPSAVAWTLLLFIDQLVPLSRKETGRKDLFRLVHRIAWRMRGSYCARQQSGLHGLTFLCLLYVPPFASHRVRVEASTSGSRRPFLYIRNAINDECEISIPPLFFD
jgi:hypothetical protein